MSEGWDEPPPIRLVCLRSGPGTLEIQCGLLSLTLSLRCLQFQSPLIIGVDVFCRFRNIRNQQWPSLNRIQWWGKKVESHRNLHSCSAQSAILHREMPHADTGPDQPMSFAVWQNKDPLTEGPGPLTGPLSSELPQKRSGPLSPELVGLLDCWHLVALQRLEATRLAGQTTFGGTHPNFRACGNWFRIVQLEETYVEYSLAGEVGGAAQCTARDSRCDSVADERPET